MCSQWGLSVGIVGTNHPCELGLVIKLVNTTLSQTYVAIAPCRHGARQARLLRIDHLLAIVASLPSQWLTVFFPFYFSCFIFYQHISFPTIGVYPIFDLWIDGIVFLVP